MFSQDNNNIPRNEYQQVNKLKLPELPLPCFGNSEGENLIQFFINFENILDKYQLGDFEKFIYLEKSLSGDALTLIKSLTGIKRSYNEAKNILNAAFARPIVQKFDFVEKLSKLKCDISDPYKFISNVKLLETGFSDLEIDIELIFQYFVWNALPVSYQTQIVNVTNNSYPTLKEILDNIFTVIDRLKLKSNQKISDDHISLAANIEVKPNNFKIRNCGLCPNNEAQSHPIYKCEKYPDPKSKIERLKQLNFCLKCAGIKHKTSECRFKFKKPCLKCNKTNHFSYLCFKDVSNSKPVANGICSVDFDPCILTSNNDSSSMLPTFSCIIYEILDFYVIVVHKQVLLMLPWQNLVNLIF